MKRIVYPEIEAEMARRGLTQIDVAKVLRRCPTAVLRRLSGEVDWTISDINILCHVFAKDYYELFKKEV